ncbi:MAG TPA: HAD family hydrolase [Streptomyces sp.]
MIRESSADGAPELAWSSRGGENRAAVLFDVDGVLLDSTAVHRRVWDAWSRTHALNPETVWPLTFGRRPEDTVADAAPHLDPAVERRFLDDLLAREHHAIRPMPGAASLLAALSRTPWAIVTSNTRPFVVCGSVGTPAGPVQQFRARIHREILARSRWAGPWPGLKRATSLPGWFTWEGDLGRCLPVGTASSEEGTSYDPRRTAASARAGPGR